MKKYLAAAAVAVMVFAFSAFAASLNLDGGVLQAGENTDLTCTDQEVPVRWIIDNNDGLVYGAHVAVPESCYGNKLYFNMKMPERGTGSNSELKATVNFDSIHPPTSLGNNPANMGFRNAQAAAVTTNASLNNNGEVTFRIPTTGANTPVLPAEIESVRLIIAN